MTTRFTTFRLTLLASATMCLSSHAMAAPHDLRPEGLSGQLFGMWSPGHPAPYHFETSLTAGGAVGAFVTNGEPGGIINDLGAGPALIMKTLKLSYALSSVLSPAFVEGDSVVQGFSSLGALSIQLSGVPDNFLSGHIIGGTVQGSLNTDAPLTVTFRLADLRSDMLALSGSSSSTLTMTLARSSPLSFICATPDPTGACADGADRYLSSFSLYSSWSNGYPAMSWQLSPDLIAAAVPEPAAWLLFPLGLLACGVITRRAAPHAVFCRR